MILSGVLYNAGGPVRLAKIVFIATKTSLNGVLKGAYREFITQEDGTYFLDLEPGYYRVEWYPSKGPAVRLGTVTADDETMATLPEALRADGQPVNPDIVKDEVQQALDQIQTLRDEAEGFANDAAGSAASVDAQNIVHAPGSGLENEAGTAYSYAVGSGSQQLPRNADLGALSRVDVLSDAEVGDIDELLQNLGVEGEGAIASVGYVDEGLEQRVAVGAVGGEEVTTSTGMQTVVDALDNRSDELGLVSLERWISNADGDGEGGGTNYGEKIQEAINWCSENNKTLIIPFLGSGIYRVDIPIFSNGMTSIEFMNGAAFDFTNIKIGHQAYCWTVSGSFGGGEIAISTAANRGDTLLSTVTQHGLSAGDWVLLRSQRNALHPDATPQWQLGIPTGQTLDSHAAYFAEPVQVDKIESPTSFTIQDRLIFPAYRPDKSLETSPLARDSATIQKIVFLEDAQFKKPKFFINGTNCILFNLCKDHVVEKGKCFSGEGVGSFVQNKNSLNGSFDVACERPENWDATRDHSQYNAFKELSSWFSNWYFEDRYGVQGLDVTYVINGEVTISPTISGRAFDNREQAMTFHAGCYGFSVPLLESYRSKQSALYCRSRFGYVGHVHAIGPGVNTLGAVQLNQWGVDIQIGTIFSDGHAWALEIGGEQGTAGGIENRQPLTKNISIGSIKALRCKRAVSLLTHYYGDVENNIRSNISIDKINVSEWSEEAIYFGRYVNGVDIGKIKLSAPVAATEGIYFSNDNSFCNIDSVDFYQGTPQRCIRLPSRGNKSIYPDSIYGIGNGGLPNRIGRVSNGANDITNSGASSMMPIYGSNYTITAKDVFLGLVAVESADEIIVTVPFSSDIIPFNSPIVIVNRGSADAIINSTGSGNFPKTVPPGGAATVTRVGTNFWVIN